MKLCVSGPTHSQLPARASQWTVGVEFSETTVKDSLKSDFSQRNENEAYVFVTLHYCAKLAFQDSTVQGGHEPPFQPHNGTWLLLYSDWSLLITAPVLPITRVFSFQCRE